MWHEYGKEEDYKVLVGKPEGDYSENRGVDGRMGT
jgi:hypothetical protein